MTEERRDEIISRLVDPLSHPREMKQLCDELFDTDDIESLAAIWHAVNKTFIEQDGGLTPRFLMKDNIIQLDGTIHTMDAIAHLSQSLSMGGHCYVYSFWCRGRNLETGNVFHEDILFTVAASSDGDSIYRITQPFDALGHGRIRWKEPFEKGYRSREELSKEMSRFRRIL